MAVIAGHAGYVPLYRIERETIAAQHGGRASGETAVPARDENHVTMASEAAGIALERAGIDGGDLDAVYSASVTDPFAEHGLAAHVAFRHDATGDVRTGDFRGSTRAATDAVLAGLDRVAADDATVLVVAADVLPVEAGHDDEAESGAGAGAIVLTDDAAAPVATVTGTGTETTGFVERHRKHGEPAIAGDAKFEGQYGTGPAVEAAAGTALAGSEPDRAVIATPNQRSAAAATKGFDGLERVATFDAVGFAGAATFFLDLAQLLEAGEAGSALAVAAGGGGADALALDVAGETPDDDTVAAQLESKEYVTYATHLEYREPVEYQGVVSP